MAVTSANIMFVALHGEFRAHPWRDARAARADAYSLFVARASAMGWLAEPSAGTAGGVWGMNDAGHDARSRSDPPLRIAWFQVVLVDRIAAGRPLPLQSFLSCADDVVARMGSANLRAIQVLLPERRVDEAPDASRRAKAVMTLLQDAGWFADCEPRSKTQVRATLEGGQDAAIPSAPRMLDWMTSFEQDVFSPRSCSSTDDGHLEPAVIDKLWQVPAHHRLTFCGGLAEWSMAALGWLGAFLAEASSQHGVSAPLLLTVRPDPILAPADG
jgi:hypothetical protein